MDLVYLVGLLIVMVLALALNQMQKARAVAESAAATPETLAASNAKKAADANTLRAFFALLILGGVMWYFFGGGLEKQAGANMQKITDQVASDAEVQYGIAKRQGDRMQICVQAGLVAAAYLQAKNESQYQAWKNTEADDCRRAGVPR